MNEPIDKEISALYRDASQEQPPAHLDDAILAAAKREVRAGPKPLSPFSTKWTLPFSLAAVIVLSVSVVTLVQKESPNEIASGIASIKEADDETLYFKEQEITEKAPKEEKQTEKKIAKLKMKAERSEVETEQISPSARAMPPAPAEQPAPPQRLAKSPAPKPKLSSGLQADVARSDISAPASAEQPVTRGTAKSPEETLLADQETKSEVKRPRKPATEETLVAATDSADNEPGETSASSSTPKEESRKASSGQALGFTKRKAQPQTHPEMAAAAQPSAAPETETPLSIMPQAVISASEPTSAPSCSSLSARDCLQSSHCTYELKAESDKTDKRYVCRDTAGQCEQNFRQLTGTKQSCESKPGCRYMPGHCECSEGMPCDCQNKNPPQCSDSNH
jgi:hypothetical protein